MGNQLNDSDFGTRDKRGHWKPFGTISINPPKDIFFNPIKFLKYFFKFPGIFFPHFDLPMPLFDSVDNVIL